jgi:phosphoglycerate dehydrogenase-like enzyme
MLMHDSPGTPASSEARVWVWPESGLLEAAVRSGGGSVVPLEQANAIVCTGDDVELLRRSILPDVRWVQLGAAGIELWLDAGLMQPNVIWTAAKGVYARPIAEHILALILAAARDLPKRARARTWGTAGGRLVAGATVGVVGAGGIGTELISLLAPLGLRAIALTRNGRSVPGADISVGPEELGSLLARSDYVVLTTALTAETKGMMSAERLACMRRDAWLVNVARGELVHTSALVSALRAGTIGGAALDVTDPEPLPAGHPLWTLPNVVITPHVASTWAMGAEFLAQRVEENVRRFSLGQDLLGRVDLVLGY